MWYNTTVKGERLLADAHARLMAYHANKSILLPAGTASNLPTQAIVAFWDSAITWVGGGWSSMKVCSLTATLCQLTAVLACHLSVVIVCVLAEVGCHGVPADCPLKPL